MVAVKEWSPFYHAAIALLEQTMADAEKTLALVKARRLATAATASNIAGVPSFLQKRMA